MWGSSGYPCDPWSLGFNASPSGPEVGFLLCQMGITSSSQPLSFQQGNGHRAGPCSSGEAWTLSPAGRLPGTHSFSDVLMRLASQPTPTGHVHFAGEKTEAREGKSLACGQTVRTDQHKNPGLLASRTQDLNHDPSPPGGSRGVTCHQSLLPRVTDCRQRPWQVQHPAQRLVDTDIH